MLRQLPGTLTGHERQKVSGSRYAVAWGDPAIVLRCGVGRPKGFDRFSQCQSYDGVDWYVPDSASTDQSTDVVATTVGRSPAVEVTIPAADRPPVGELVDVGRVVRRTTRLTHPCR